MKKIGQKKSNNVWMEKSERLFIIGFTCDVHRTPSIFSLVLVADQWLAIRLRRTVNVMPCLLHVTYVVLTRDYNNGCRE